MVEVTIKGTLSEQGGAKREVLLHRTQAVTRNGSFDVAPEATADGVPPYRFHVQVVF